MVHIFRIDLFQGHISEKQVVRTVPTALLWPWYGMRSCCFRSLPTSTLKRPIYSNILSCRSGVISQTYSGKKKGERALLNTRSQLDRSFSTCSRVLRKFLFWPGLSSRIQIPLGDRSRECEDRPSKGRNSRSNSTR